MPRSGSRRVCPGSGGTGKPPANGSISSGGRYDSLASDGKVTFPGVGYSFGITRILAPLIGKGRLVASRSVPSAVLVAVDNEESREQAIAVAACHARDYVSEPPNVLYPVEFARRARAMADTVGLKFSVLDEAEMQALGMNILLAVSQGSEREAQLIILDHAPAGTEDRSRKA